MTDDLPHDDFDIPSEDTPFRELWAYSPDQLATILATPYDEDIKSLLNALNTLTEFTTQDFHDLLHRAKVLCEETFGLPENATLGAMRKHQECSDLVVLGMLTHEWATRGGEVADNLGGQG
jgi:hypothetical protein